MTKGFSLSGCITCFLLFLLQDRIYLGLVIHKAGIHRLEVRSQSQGTIGMVVFLEAGHGVGDLILSFFRGGQHSWACSPNRGYSSLSMRLFLLRAGMSSHQGDWCLQGGAVSHQESLTVTSPSCKMWTPGVGSGCDESFLTRHQAAVKKEKSQLQWFQDDIGTPNCPCPKKAAL